jgi:hypothetical protein
MRARRPYDASVDPTNLAKQRHTAAQLFRRLQDEPGYPGSYPTVRSYVAAYRLTRWARVA